MMLRDYCCCCYGAPSFDSADIADRDPVLLVSGIGGSILHSKRKKFGFQTRVWVRILLADLEFKKKIWSIYNPETGYTEPLDDSTEIVVPQDDYGLYAIDILDPSIFVKCLHLTDVYHFHDMIDMLVGCGYKKGTTLFGYGYDFRQSNRIGQLMNGLKERLETAYKASGGRKIFSKYVSKWITIATPFQGAPGCINDSLLTGMQFVEGFESYFFVSRWSMHQLLVECPSVYEMLPNPNFNWKKQPEIQLNYDGKTVALPFNFAILKWAAGTREVLDKTQIPRGYLSTTYMEHFDTPFDVCYGSESSPIDELSEICHTTADKFDAVERVGVSASHRGLLKDENVFQLIKKWLGVSEKATKVRHSKTSKVMDASSRKLELVDM
ncbi:Phospholipase A(1) LCAT3 [Sesamum angolense]|uniref:Phospholipase A(1) LCAT3 n=1 Tax=Sesamum angolense TaxID=2727404 RepID=A0AAE2BHR1_9LAMI|nr:Phospholipase A(1) LCAT3 [Sesamum angolense]